MLLAIKNTYRSKELILDFQDPFVDLLCVKVYINEFNFIYIIVLYIDPQCTIGNVGNLYYYLECSAFLYKSNFVILGDFNITRLIEYYSNNDVSDSYVNEFINFLNFFDCIQYNYIINYFGHLLDLVVSNTKCRVDRGTVSFVNEDKHHPTLCIHVSLKCEELKQLPLSITNYYNFKKANYNLMYDLFKNVNWSGLSTLT